MSREFLRTLFATRKKQSRHRVSGRGYSRRCTIESLESRELLYATGVFDRTDGNVDAFAGPTANGTGPGAVYAPGNSPLETLAEATQSASDHGANSSAMSEALHSPAIGSSAGAAFADVTVGVSAHVGSGSDNGAAVAEGYGHSDGVYTLSLSGTPVNPLYHGHWLLTSAGTSNSGSHSVATAASELRVDVFTATDDWYVQAIPVNGGDQPPEWEVSYHLPDRADASFSETDGFYLAYDITWAYDNGTSAEVKSFVDSEASGGTYVPYTDTASAEINSDAQGWLRIDDAPHGVAIIPGGTTVPNPQASLVPPKVADVVISNSSAGLNYDFSGNVGSQKQLLTVPVGHANQITIQFTKGVTVSSGDLTLISLNRAVAVPSLSGSGGFTAPDAGNNYTATWNFASSLLAAQYEIWLPDTIVDANTNALDGEWTNPGSYNPSGSSNITTVFPSGNDVAGGDFKFVFTILPGDIRSVASAGSPDLLVGSNDYAVFLANYESTPGPGGKDWFHGDFTGDGHTNSSDFALLLANYGNNWQTLQLVGDSDHDGALSSTEKSVFDSTPTDINGDGLANSSDVAAFDAIYAAVGSSTSNPLRLLI
jgi:hypothetical protein